jgi:uncharacterized membrane protein
MENQSILIAGDDGILTVLLWAGALGSGLIGGIFFAFSAFIMSAFSRIEPEQGIAAMKSINSAILRSLFIPVFFGTAIVSAIAAVWSLVRLDDSGTIVTVAAGALYIFGVIVPTIAFNVPLNNALAAVDAGSAEAMPVWSRYLKDWVLWNHVRTVAAIAACALFVLAL